MVVWVIIGARRMGKTTLADALVPTGRWLEYIPEPDEGGLPAKLVFSDRLAVDRESRDAVERYCRQNVDNKTIVWEVQSWNGLSPEFRDDPRIFKVWVGVDKMRVL